MLRSRYQDGKTKGQNKLMEKETILGDEEMVGLPQSGGRRRQRMAAGDTHLSQEDRSTECSAAPSVIPRPGEHLTALEDNRPDASAASSQRTSRRTAGNRSHDGNKTALGRSREGDTVAADRLRGGNKVAAGRLRSGRSVFAAGRKMAAEDSDLGEEKGMTRNGGAAGETAADSGVGKVAADGLRVGGAALVDWRLCCEGAAIQLGALVDWGLRCVVDTVAAADRLTGRGCMQQLWWIGGCAVWWAQWQQVG